MWRRSWNCNFELQMKSSLTTHLANQQLLHEKLDDINFTRSFKHWSFMDVGVQFHLPVWVALLDEEEEETQLLQMQNAKQFSESGNKNFNPHCKCKEQGNPQTSMPCFCNSSSPVGNGFLYLSTLVASSPNNLYSFLFHYILRFWIGNSRWWWWGWCRKKKTKGLKHDLHGDDDAEEEDEGNGTWSAYLPGKMMMMITICARRLWIPLSPRRWRWSAQEDDGSLSLLMIMLMIC